MSVSTRKATATPLQKHLQRNCVLGCRQFQIELSTHSNEPWQRAKAVFLFSRYRTTLVRKLQRRLPGGEILSSDANAALNSYKKKELPHHIFDEADTGISGDVAARGKVAERRGTLNAASANNAYLQMQRMANLTTSCIRGIKDGTAETHLKKLTTDNTE